MYLLSSKNKFLVFDGPKFKSSRSESSVTYLKEKIPNLMDGVVYLATDPIKYAKYTEKFD